MAADAMYLTDERYVRLGKVVDDAPLSRVLDIAMEGLDLPLSVSIPGQMTCKYLVVTPAMLDAILDEPYGVGTTDANDEVGLEEPPPPEFLLIHGDYQETKIRLSEIAQITKMKENCGGNFCIFTSGGSLIDVPTHCPDFAVTQAFYDSMTAVNPPAPVSPAGETSQT